MSNHLERIGIASFLVGAIVALFAGIVSLESTAQNYVTAVLGILGIIVGFLNIASKEKVAFLVSTVALIIAFSTLKTILGNIILFGIGDFFVRVLSNLIVFVAPAAAVVALKEIYSFATERQVK